MNTARNQQNRNMNREFFIIVFVLALSLLQYSCDPADLYVLNPNQIPAESWFKNEDQVKKAVNAIYAGLQTRGLYQRTLYYAMDNLAYEQLMNPSAEVDKLQYSLYSFTAEHTAIVDYWKSCYAGIRSANYVIDHENVIENQKYPGEAHFLRALYYFLLVTRFGGVPLVTGNSANLEGLPRSPAADIWNLIEGDLSFAAAHCLPKSMEEKGRATSGAAWALLGKAFLFQANASGSQAGYLNAKNAFLKVLQDPGYALEDRYLNNFEEETEHGLESIFEVEFNADAGYSDEWSAGDNGTGYNEITFRGKEYGLRDWFTVYPTENLLDEFEPGDPRFGFCFYSTGDVFNKGNDTIQEIGINRRAGWRKYQNYYKQKFEHIESGINTKVMRLADVYLMLAEVENETGNLQEAVGYLNQVRNRPDVMMPEYGTPEMNALFPVNDQAAIRRAIEHERKVELCGEQVRFNDLIRWRRLEAFVTLDIIPYLPEYLKMQVQFDPEVHYLWPIPQREIDNNQAMTDADQNPGY